MKELGELAGKLLADDDDIKQRIRALVHKMVDEAEDIIETATPQIKATLIRAVIPAMLREMKEEKEDQTYAELKAQMDVLQAEMRAGVQSQGRPVPVAPPIPLDVPRPPPPAS